MENRATKFNPDELELWGGLACTINRVQDRYHSQLDRNGHGRRPDDIERFASLGICAMRYPVLWEHVAPMGLACANWSIADEQLQALRDRNVTPILGLVHSGPQHTSLLDPHFATGLAQYAAAVAARYPWAGYYTVVNEPLTTARFACLYGLWSPHAQTDEAFLRALVVQCKATVLAMSAIRAVNPDAKLVQTDDLGKTYGTQTMQATAAFYHERRWLGWDLWCGMVGPTHRLRSYCIKNGVTPAELAWFQEHPCRPDSPRPTAVATIMRQLAAGRTPHHSVLHGKGWWRRPERFLCAPVATPEAFAFISADGHHARRGEPAPILISGASGTLGRAFARMCKLRKLAYRLLSRHEMDIADTASVEAAVARCKPWALINASGYVRVDEAEHDTERCMRENTAGPTILAKVCARHISQHFQATWCSTGAAIRRMWSVIRPIP